MKRLIFALLLLFVGLLVSPSIHAQAAGSASDLHFNGFVIYNEAGRLEKSGDLDMALISSPDQLKPESAGHPAPQREHLGRWRLSGEICDGKCAAGAMRPGSGASHKACANLCISSGLPPVLALGRPFEGREVLILAGENGGPVPGELLDRVGILVTLEGDARRLGDAIIFQVGNSIR